MGRQGTRASGNGQRLRFGGLGSVSMNDLHFKTLTELSEQIRMRSISPVEVTRHLLERINEFDPMLTCYVTIGHEGKTVAPKLRQ